MRVLLTDDHAILIEGLRAYLSYYDDVEVVGEAHDGAEALASVAELQPDIVLMDIAMPGINGITATRLIREQYPQTRVLVLTQHEEKQYVLALLKAGASGYILKRALGSDLINALRTVARGGTFLYPTVATLLVEEMKHPTVSLTPREAEVLQHIVRGETSSQIADSLSLSVKTVEWHRSNLMSKLNVHGVADLVRYALEHELA
ncbi:MAG TPA: response regulator transcription factor [Desulfuromonadaceae bacterium]|jgi:DNA-binding NarL/FixJ family response regulator